MSIYDIGHSMAVIEIYLNQYLKRKKKVITQKENSTAVKLPSPMEGIMQISKN